MAESTVVSCPNCAKKFKVSSEKLGRTFKCTGCEARFVAGAETIEPPAAQEVLEQASSFARPPFDPAMSDMSSAEQVTPPPVDYGSPATGKPKTSGMAIASLICGILLCLAPISSVFALIFGYLGIKKTGPGQAGGRGMAIAGLVLGGVGILLSILSIAVLLPSLNRAREFAYRAQCASNLHRIGLAMLLYRNENQQQFPPDLTTLWKTQQLDAKVFICPSSSDTPAASPAQLESGGHCSYKYLYPGPHNGNPDSTTVILYDNDPNHKAAGTNMLFGDGSAMWESPSEATKLLAATEAMRRQNQ